MQISRSSRVAGRSGRGNAAIYHKMSYSLGRAVKTLRLEESVVRLAENLASRYNVSVPQLIEALLLDYAEREMQDQASPAPALMQLQPSREDDRVIDFSEARLRRRQRDAARFPMSGDAG